MTQLVQVLEKTVSPGKRLDVYVYIFRFDIYVSCMNS